MRSNINTIVLSRKALFNKMILQAEKYYRLGLLEKASSILNIASAYGYTRHFGEFYSQNIEEILSKISKATMSKKIGKSHFKEAKKILHVASEFYAVGGHTRLFLNWIKYDLSRSHSLIMTNQKKHDLPDNAMIAITEYCDDIICLKDSSSRFIERGKKLRYEAGEYDLIVLHIHPQDVIPSIAFYDFDVPIVMVNHSDHTFWVGRNIISFLAEIRESGKKISNEQRYISDKYQYILPIPLEKPMTRDKLEIRNSLGFNKEDIVIFSAASSYKYKEINGKRIDHILIQLLIKYQNLKVVVVGPSGKQPFWKEFNVKSNNRVQALGVIEDITDYYIAADLYVDSYPTGSLTSILDAGKYGLPIFSLSEGEMKLDDPALLKLDFWFENAEELISKMSEMIKNPTERERYALECQRSICSYHVKEGWLSHLEQFYYSLKCSLQSDDSKFLTIDDISDRGYDEKLVYMYSQNKNIEVDVVQLFNNKISLLIQMEGIRAVLIILESFLSDPRTTLKAFIPYKVKKYLSGFSR